MYIISDLGPTVQDTLSNCQAVYDKGKAQSDPEIRFAQLSEIVELHKMLAVEKSLKARLHPQELIVRVPMNGRCFGEAIKVTCDAQDEEKMTIDIIFRGIVETLKMVQFGSAESFLKDLCAEHAQTISRNNADYAGLDESSSHALVVFRNIEVEIIKPDGISVLLTPMESANILWLDIPTMPPKYRVKLVHTYVPASF